MRSFQIAILALSYYFCVDAFAITGADMGKMVTDIENTLAKAVTMKKTALANNFYNLEKKPYCTYLKAHSTLGVRIIGQISIFNDSIRSLGPDAEQALRGNPEFKGLFSTLKETGLFADKATREDEEMLKLYCSATDEKESATGDRKATDKAIGSSVGWTSTIEDTQGGDVFSILPSAPRKGVVINLAEKRMYVYSQISDDGQLTRVMSFPVNLVRVDNSAIGVSIISAKRNHPLGTLAIYFLGRKCVIHGVAAMRYTGHDHSRSDSAELVPNEFELSREDMPTLFQSTEIGTQVMLVIQPIKVGWREGGLYIEVHPPFGEESKTLDEWLSWTMSLIDTITAGRTSYTLDTNTLKQALRQRSGIPVRIGHEMNIPQ